MTKDIQIVLTDAGSKEQAIEHIRDAPAGFEMVLRKVDKSLPNPSTVEYSSGQLRITLHEENLPTLLGEFFRMENLTKQTMEDLMKGMPDVFEEHSLIQDMLNGVVCCMQEDDDDDDIKSVKDIKFYYKVGANDDEVFDDGDFDDKDKDVGKIKGKGFDWDTLGGEITGEENPYEIVVHNFTEDKNIKLVVTDERGVGIDQIYNFDFEVMEPSDKIIKTNDVILVSYEDEIFAFRVLKNSTDLTDNDTLPAKFLMGVGKKNIDALVNIDMNKLEHSNDDAQQLVNSYRISLESDTLDKYLVDTNE